MKSSKAIPVMIMGTLIGGKVYSAMEYLSTLLIAAGISLFAYKGSSKVRVPVQNVESMKLDQPRLRFKSS